MAGEEVASPAVDEREKDRSAIDKADTLYGLVVGLLYVVAVGVQVYMVVDEVTHGALTADVKARWHRLTEAAAARRRIDRTVKAEAPWVVFEAITALEENP